LAQANQAEARAIAAAGAAFARDMSVEKMWVAYAALPLGEVRKAYHTVRGDGGGATPSVSAEYTELVKQLVPVFTYDASRVGVEEGDDEGDGGKGGGEGGGTDVRDLSPSGTAVLLLDAESVRHAGA